MTATALEWTAIAESAERAKQPDNGLVGCVVCAAQGVPFGSTRIACDDDDSEELQIFDATGGHVASFYRNRAPDVSVDAALDLIAKTLPGRDIDAELSISVSNHSYCACTLYVAELDKGDTRHFSCSEMCSTPALALCAAFARAMAAQAEEAGS